MQLESTGEIVMLNLITIPFTDFDQIHHCTNSVYGSVTGIEAAAQRMYSVRFLGRQFRNVQTSLRIHQKLCESRYSCASRCDVNIGRYRRISLLQEVVLESVEVNSTRRTRCIERALCMSLLALLKILNLKKATVSLADCTNLEFLEISPCVVTLPFRGTCSRLQKISPSLRICNSLKYYLFTERYD